MPEKFVSLLTLTLEKRENWGTSNHSLPGTLHFGAALEKVGTSWKGFWKHVQVEDIWLEVGKLPTFQHSLHKQGWWYIDHPDRKEILEETHAHNRNWRFYQIFWQQCFQTTKVHTGCQVRKRFPSTWAKWTETCTQLSCFTGKPRTAMPQRFSGLDWHNIVLGSKMITFLQYLFTNMNQDPHQKHWHLLFGSVVSFKPSYSLPCP